MEHGEQEPSRNKGPEQDPRKQFADRLRAFARQALRQQADNDREAELTALADGKEFIPAGFLYKTENGFMKVRLETPATDEIVDGPTEVKDKTDAPKLPHIWVLIPIMGAASFDTAIDFSPSVLVHVRKPGEQSLQFLVRDDYVGPLAPINDTIENLDAYTEPEEGEQLGSAEHWLKVLKNYDIRTISSSNPPEFVAYPDVNPESEVA